MKKSTTFAPSKKSQGLIEKLEALAEKENRTLNNYLEIILSKHVETESKK